MTAIIMDSVFKTTRSTFATLVTNYLVRDVMDSDVMHGCSVALEQSVKVSPTVSAIVETKKKGSTIIFRF